MHGHDALRDALEQFDRVVAGDVGVAGVVVHAEAVGGQGVHQGAEDVHLLRELRVEPEVVLVVVLEDERHAAFLGMRDAGADAVGGEAHTFGVGELGATLAAKHAAVGPAQRVGHVNPALLLGDLGVAKGLVRMREVGRAAHHRDGHPEVGDLTAEDRPVGLVGHLEEARVEFQALNIERGGECEPLGEFHRAVFAEGMHVGLREGGDLRHGQAFCPGRVSGSFGGLRPMKGCCSSSTTEPLIGPASSASQ